MILLLYIPFILCALSHFYQFIRLAVRQNTVFDDAQPLLCPHRENRFPPARGRRLQRKIHQKSPPPEWSFHPRTRACRFRVTTLLRPHLTVRTSAGTAIPRPCNGSPPPQPYRILCGSVRGSKAIFRRALRIPLAPSGIRFAVLHRVLSFSLPMIRYGFIIAFSRRAVNRPARRTHK